MNWMSLEEDIEEHDTEIEVLKWEEEKKIAYRDGITAECTTFYDEEEITVNELYERVKKLIYRVSIKNQVMKTIRWKKTQKRNNWFNRECAIKKRKLRKTLRMCKLKKYDDQVIKQLNEDRKAYREEIIKAKQEMNLNIKEKIKNTRNRTQLWETINRFKIKKGSMNRISKARWEQFLKDIHPEMNSNNEIVMTDARHPVLDAEITPDEIVAVLKKTKSGKAPGVDKIPYEFLKNLPEEGYGFLHLLFNRVMEEEIVPNNWTKVVNQMIFKKGNPEDPLNFRGISLINTVTKSFTSILERRISSWAEESGVLDEGQAGFRKGRGCRDNIFNLYAAISINIRDNRSKVYACFVDYRRCFDSIDHTLLWRKLFSIGLTGKCLRILKQLYENSTVCIRTEKGETSPIKITQGVLTGDSLSPLLFILFISDLGEFMRSKGIQGLTAPKLITLLYADDLVLLTNQEEELQLMLDALEAYCLLNKLEVNVSKTKIVVFRRKGKLRNGLSFTYQRNQVEIVPSYVYLGVLFTSGLCFSENVKRFMNKTLGAICTVNSLWARTRTFNWDANMIVYNSVVKSTLLYGAEVWALRYLEEMERPQVKYLKSLLYLPRNTPNYMVRKETGLDKIEQEIFRRAINWLITIKQMEDHRLPKICFQKLEERAIANPTDITFNWVAQLRQKFTRLDLLHLFEAQDPKTLKDQTDLIIAKFQDLNRAEDKRRIEESSYSENYKDIFDPTSFKEQIYLQMDAPFYKIRAISQLRTSAQKLVRITIHKDVHVIETQEVCSLCNLRKEESLVHFILECPVYNATRERFIRKHYQDEDNETPQTQLKLMLNISSVEKLNDLYSYVEISLKFRHNILSEYD